MENPDGPHFSHRILAGENSYTQKILEVYNFSTLTLYTQINCALFVTLLDHTLNREGHGAMVRAWRGTSPSNASLDSGENEYLVGQRWQ